MGKRKKSATNEITKYIDSRVEWAKNENMLGLRLKLIMERYSELRSYTSLTVEEKAELADHLALAKLTREYEDMKQAGASKEQLSEMLWAIRATVADWKYKVL